ncbi:MAG: TRAP-type C4-dicarboxylate transport system substrate-binding protein [Verrucomicrobiales bacterium]|jgi:TRAP-type C4-dicarboxylate transport system substrate-binding protein
MTLTNRRTLDAALIFLLAWSATAEARDIDVPIIWPKGSRWHIQVSNAAKKVKLRTAGRVDVNLINEPVLGDVPGVSLYSLPLVFKDEDQIAYVRERMDSKLIALLAKHGYETIGIEGLGMAHIFSKQEARAPAAFLATRMWVPDEKGSTMAKRFGVKEVVPVPIMDVRKALDKNQLDTVVTVPSSVVLARWQEGVDFVADWPLAYVYSPMVIKKTDFDALMEKDQKILREVLGEAFEEAGASSRRMSKQAWGTIRKREKIEIMSQTAAEAEAWKTWAAKVRAQLISDGKIPADLAAELDQHLKASE